MDQPRLEFAFKIKVEFALRVKGEADSFGVKRGFTGNGGGTIEGPMLNGSVPANGGGDWPFFWPDGVVHFNSQYILESAEGDLIVIRNRGCRHAPPEVLARMNAFEEVGPDEYYFRIIPKFHAPKGKYEWLNTSLMVGRAQRTQHHSNFFYYLVH